jgi:F-type H+-transporting ATPase subunit delta
MSVAKTYAQALYEASADAKTSAADLDQIEAQLDRVIELLSTSQEARTALVSPVISGKQRAAAIEELGRKLGFVPLLIHFLGLLARKGRMGVLADVREAFASARLGAEGGVFGRLVSAEAMTAEDSQSLSQSFSKKLGKKVQFRASVDPTLLAGVKVTVNGVTYDGTLRAQLDRLRDSLLKSPAN